MSCIACQRGHLHHFLDFASPVSVSSDCKPLNFSHAIAQCESCGLIQKNLSSHYFTNIDSLYSHYDPYTLTNGTEGINFGGEVPQSRCLSILDNASAYLPASGMWLDMGTGSGVMPQSLNMRCENRYTIWCQDLNAQHKAMLESFSYVAGFIQGDIDQHSERYDVISLIHVLEHVVDPLLLLKKIKSKMHTNGKLLIQVPDISTNYLDLAIYDHIAHFTRQTLYDLVTQIFPNAFFSEKQLTKEITIIASADPDEYGAPLEITKIDAQQIQKQFRQFEQMVLAINEPVLVFGTGPSSIYTAALLGDHCAGWLDEDLSKVGKKLSGKIIYSADEYPAGYKVLLPFQSPQKDQILTRLNNINWFTSFTNETT